MQLKAREQGRPSLFSYRKIYSKSLHNLMRLHTLANVQGSGGDGGAEGERAGSAPATTSQRKAAASATAAAAGSRQVRQACQQKPFLEAVLWEVCNAWRATREFPEACGQSPAASGLCSVRLRHKGRLS